jgi:Uma2 family endonuclease
MNDEFDVIEEEEIQEVGSLNHSCLQANLTTLLKNTGKYTVCTELSLDISQLDMNQFNLKTKEELKPDICIYPKRKINPSHDILKMSEMPLLGIEVLSPTQTVQTILNKFEVYFALGIKSCWLIIPTSQLVTIYSSLNHFKNFASGLSNEVIDEALDIRLPFQEIFE